MSKNNEPNIALYAEDNGIYYYKKIISYLDSITNDKFMISFELGDNTYTYLKKYLEDINFSYKYVFEKDYNDFYRYLFIFSE
jgi:Methylase of polypeptide chain release factors